MKRFVYFLVIIVVTASVLAAVFFREALARYAWERLRWPDPAIALIRRDADLLVSIGDYYFNGGAYDLERARSAYQGATIADAGSAAAHYQLARIHFVEGRNYDALQEIDRAIALAPGNLRALYIRGLVRGTVGDARGAAEDFERFVAWAPREWAGYNDLAWALSKQGKWEEMRDVAARGIAEAAGGEGNPWLWNMLGVAYLNLKKYSDAHNALSRAQERALVIGVSGWQQAYPGNNPDESAAGYVAFITAIEDNFAAVARAVDNAY